MKDQNLFAAVVVVLIIPGMLFSLIPNSNNDLLQPTQITEPNLEIQQRDTSVRIKTEEGVISMELEEYVAGVLGGEMPADFDMEALKAQSVAIRTYTLKKLNGSKHTDADICTDPTCCQAFSANVDERIKSAVATTQGQVLTYGEELIDATYFSCSGGKTEDAAAVWGADVPYLQSQVSPGEEIAAHYVDTVKLERAEFLRQLQMDPGETVTIGKIEYTDGGGVKTIEINDRELKGTEVRKLLKLSSTVFQIQPLDNSVIITTKGYGHRVGLSQYGAEAMAVSGSSYLQILQHYYTGVEVKTLTQQQIEGIFDKAGIL